MPGVLLFGSLEAVSARGSDGYTAYASQAWGSRLQVLV